MDTGLRHTLSGISNIHEGTATSSCGGAVGSSGNTLTWTGGTVPAAPASGTVTCTITVQVTANTTPSTYTATVPAGALTTAAGVSNRFSASASFNSTPLLLPTLEAAMTDSRVAYNYFGMQFLQMPGATSGVALTNQNAVPLNLRSAVLNVNPQFSGAPTLSGPGCQGTMGAISTTPSYHTVQITDLTLPAAGRCLLTFDVRQSTALHYQAYTDGVPSSTPATVGFTMPQIRLNEVDQDTSMANKTVSARYSATGRVPIGFAKLINHQDRLTVSGGRDNTLTLSLLVKNNTRETRFFSYQDPLIAAGDYSASSVVSVAETRDQENTNDYSSGSQVARTPRPAAHRASTLTGRRNWCSTAMWRCLRPAFAGLM
ncbi:hypothetical protein [Deinococcus multiflagellatus]|uniref:Uncharacterized protein n=1 Tax=Deinococcus multiflagellatus TaxID=1656887 RepID=A0ABW1ZNU4_9DEIO